MTHLTCNFGLIDCVLNLLELFELDDLDNIGFIVFLINQLEEGCFIYAIKRITRYLPAFFLSNLVKELSWSSHMTIDYYKT